MVRLTQQIRVDRGGVLLGMEAKLTRLPLVLILNILSTAAPSMGNLMNQASTATPFHCPFACLCKYENATVLCISDYYSEMPKLPYQIKTAYFRKIERLQNNAFSSCPHMKSLTISDGLKEVEPRSLDGLSYLELFYIKHTAIQTLPDDLFRDVTNLKNLFLLQNGLRQIPDRPLCHTPHLKSLRLDDNNIDSMHFGRCFRYLGNLTSIRLNYNKIVDGQIRETDLVNLANTSLEILSLLGCNISSISKHAFRFVNKLKILNIGENPLHIIASESLQPLQGLNELFLWANKLIDINFGKLKFGNLTSLSLRRNRVQLLSYSNLATIRKFPIRNLDLRLCKITFITVDAFEGFTSLEILDLSYNKLNSTALNNLFVSLNDSRFTLRELRLGPSVHKLTSDTFNASTLQKLTVLSIDGKVSYIEKGTFRHFPKLTELNIENSALEHVSIGAFHGIEKLKKLSLRNNLLTILPGWDLKYLEELDLSRNRVTTTHKITFLHMVNLEVLLLSQNGLTNEDITPGIFSHLRKLKRLDLSRNNIKTSLNNRVSPFHTLTSLERLDLNGNQVTQIDRNVFASLTNLKMLNLAFNNLWFQEKDVQHVFSGLRALEVLSLRSCGLSVIPANMFSGLTNLRTLYLGGNLINSWNPGSFKSLGNLTMISINNNRISLINQTSFKWLKSLQVLDLSNNPFDCGCGLIWFRDWIKQSHIGLYFTSPRKHRNEINKRHIYECFSPDKMQGSSLFEFKLRQRDCIINTIQLMLLWLTGACFVFVLCVCLVARYRWYLRYWWFLMKSRARQYAAVQRRDDYLFDAFVCYHVSDLKWVIKELLPNVENEHGFTFCLHHRNWLPGIGISENIVESIDKSRKTILVLSNNFARSRWCLLEASLAQHALLGDNRDVVILVMLEPIKSENLSAELHTLLVTKTYIEWTRDEQGQKLFWKRLRRALMKPETGGGVEMI